VNRDVEQLARQPDRPTRTGLALTRILPAVALLLAGVAFPLLFRAPARAVSSALPRQTGPVTLYRGLALAVDLAPSQQALEASIKSAAGSGAQVLCLVLPVFQENGASSSVFIEYRKVPLVDRLAEMVKLAKSRGLKVALMPMIHLRHPQDGEWRGNLKPAEPKAWWDGYENLVIFYAKAAEAAEADILVIGSELLSREDFGEEWRGLADRARKYFTGKLTYSTSQARDEPPEWWSDLDMIGITLQPQAGAAPEALARLARPDAAADPELERLGRTVGRDTLSLLMVNPLLLNGQGGDNGGKETVPSLITEEHD
jgi:hypothetical protein